jgi:hypothetical protein
MAQARAHGKQIEFHDLSIFAVSRADQAVSLGLQDATVRKRNSDAGINPDHIGRAAFVERIRSDTACYDQVIRQTGIRVEQ